MQARAHSPAIHLLGMPARVVHLEHLVMCHFNLIQQKVCVIHGSPLKVFHLFNNIVKQACSNIQPVSEGLGILLLAKLWP